MIHEGGNFLEEHIEKIVLAAVGLVCLWLLITRVLISPNSVEYGKGKFFGAGRIDNEILKEVDILEEKLRSRPEPMSSYERNVGKFVAKMTSAIAHVDISLAGLQPTYSSTDFSESRRYRLPQIGELSDVSVEHIQAVVYVPTSEVNGQNPYDAARSEPNDLDLVSVEAKVDAARLYASFYESFMGDDVPADWRDPCLAEPVFAAVQLQKQELLDDGSWSEWQTVPRMKIDFRKEMFEIIENVDGLPPGGIARRLFEFKGVDVRRDLLQPEAYNIASAEEEWFPPSLHKEYVDYRKKLELQKKREAIEAKKKKREEEREESRRERDVYGRRGGRYGEQEGRYGGRTGRYGEQEGRYGGRTGRSGGSLNRRPGRRGVIRGGSTSRETERESLKRRRESGKKSAVKTKTITDFYNEYKEYLITRDTRLAKMQEPLVVWAHDDTVEPGKVYRYKIRLGVFNPIAGTRQFSEQDAHRKNDVILWSEFSDVEEAVEIPKRLYFFANDMQEAAKIVTMKVYRYALGYWYSSNFKVRPGEVIGKAMEPEIEEEEEEEKKQTKEEITIPEMIDYSTGAVYVDAVATNNWSGGSNMRVRTCFDMLYSFDGTGIEHMPVSRMNWAPKMQAKFIELQETERRVKEPLRGFGARKRGRRIRPALGTEMLGELSEEEREEEAYDRW